MSERHVYWLSCTEMTVYVETSADPDEIILWAVPIARKFVRQKLERLVAWMRGKGGFQMAQIGGPAAETRSP